MAVDVQTITPPHDPGKAQSGAWPGPRPQGHETTPGAGRFKVSLHSAISGRVLQTVIDTRGTGGDVAHVQDEPRVSYLVVESTAVDWRVTVEEAVAR